MKNLAAHKKIVAAHRARNRCNEAMFKELERRFSPILAASQERWDEMLQELRQRHWELDVKLNPQNHPPEVNATPRFYEALNSTLATLQQ
jgi:CTP synthase (UTP-ammonia lyase)